MNDSDLPIITIVTPSLNQGAFIEQCLQSVLSQEYPLLELIVIDGGSTDGTVEVLRRLESRLHCWVSEPDKGQSDAINKGFRRAHGEVVAWLNSDDFLLPGALQAVAKAYAENPEAPFYYGDGLRVGLDGQGGKRFFPNGVVPFNREALARGLNYILQPATFISHKHLRAIGELDASLKYAMDTDLWLRLSARGTPVPVDACLAASREYAATKTASGAFARVEEIRRVAERHARETLSPGTLLYFLDTLASALEDGPLKTEVMRFWEHANRAASQELGVDSFMFPLASASPAASNRDVAVLVDLTELNPLCNGGIQRFAEHACRVLHHIASKSRIPVVWVVNVRGLDELRRWIGSDAFVWPYYDGMQNINKISSCFSPTHVLHPLFGANVIQYVKGAMNIAMMPDTMALDLPEVHVMFGKEDLERRKVIYEDLRQFETVLTISRFSQDRLVEHTGLARDRIPYFYLASGLLDTVEEPLPSGVPQEYLLYPANGWPHKRHELLMDVMRELWTKGYAKDLVLTGWIDERRLQELLARVPSFSNRVHYLGRISDGQLRAVYARAHALVFVSGYEGFGMPPLEAMQVGCPVVTSRRGSLPEICGDAALYVEQRDDQASEWARVITEDLPRMREQLVKRGFVQAKTFSWDRFRKDWTAFLSACGIADTTRSKSLQPWESLAAPYVLQCVHWWAEQFCGASHRAHLMSLQAGQPTTVVSGMELTRAERKVVGAIRRIKERTPFWLKHGVVRRVLRIR